MEERFFRRKLLRLMRSARGELVKAEKKFWAKKILSGVLNDFCNGLKLRPLQKSANEDFFNILKLRPLKKCYERMKEKFFRQKFLRMMRPTRGELVEAEKKFWAKKILSDASNDFCNGLKLTRIALIRINLRSLRSVDSTQLSR